MHDRNRKFHAKFNYSETIKTVTERGREMLYISLTLIGFDSFTVRVLGCTNRLNIIHVVRHVNLGYRFLTDVIFITISCLPPTLFWLCLKFVHNFIHLSYGVYFFNEIFACNADWDGIAATLNELLKSKLFSIRRVFITSNECVSVCFLQVEKRT